MTTPLVATFFDNTSQSATHIVVDDSSRFCAIIDPILGFNEATGLIDTSIADDCIAYIKKNKLKVEWILETHLHTDRLSASHYLENELGGTIGIGQAVVQLQQYYSKIFHIEKTFKADGSQFGHLFHDAERFTVGKIRCIALPTPGHSPESTTYFVGDKAFVGDTLLMPDLGTARTDMHGSNPHTLYNSIQDIFEFPPQTELYMCHDYKTDQRKRHEWVSTIEVERATNIHVNDGVLKEEFVRMRREADRLLTTPELLLPSVQVNIRAGHLPPPEDNGKRYLKIPVAELQ